MAIETSPATLTAVSPPRMEAAREPQSVPDARPTFDDLVATHQRAVFRLCYRFLGDQQAAEDATQETFAAAWRERQRRGLPGPAWLLQVAANKCRDELRRRLRHRALPLELVIANDDMPASREPGPEARALTAHQQVELRCALSRLPEDQRLAIVLSDVDGLKYREIAEATRVNVGTVKSRIFRARRSLRALLTSRF